MFRRGQWRVGWLGYIGEAKSSVISVLAKDSSENVILATVTTAGSLPSTVAGYAYGCMMIVKDSGAIYFNTGGATSCTFTVQGTLTSGIVTPIKLGVLGTYAYAGTAGTGGTASPSSANLIAGYCSFAITGITGAFAIQLPSGTALQTAFATTTVGSWFDVVIANDSSFTATITTGAGITIKGATVAIPTLKTARIRFVTTGTNTFDAIVMVSA